MALHSETFRAKQSRTCGTISSVIEALRTRSTQRHPLAGREAVVSTPTHDRRNSTETSSIPREALYEPARVPEISSIGMHHRTITLCSSSARTLRDARSTGRVVSAARVGQETHKVLPTQIADSDCIFAWTNVDRVCSRQLSQAVAGAAQLNQLEPWMRCARAPSQRAGAVPPQARARTGPAGVAVSASPRSACAGERR